MWDVFWAVCIERNVGCFLSSVYLLLMTVYLLCRGCRKWLRHWYWENRLWLNVGRQSTGVTWSWCQVTCCWKDNISSVFCRICHVCWWRFTRFCSWYDCNFSVLVYHVGCLKSALNFIALSMCVGFIFIVNIMKICKLASTYSIICCLSKLFCPKFILKIIKYYEYLCFYLQNQ